MLAYTLFSFIASLNILYKDDLRSLFLQVLLIKSAQSQTKQTSVWVEIMFAILLGW